MKKCPFCAETIQDEAIKCRFCGEFLEKKQEIKWYYRTHIIIMAFLVAGPLALPLVWINPNIKKHNKVIISLIVLLISYLLTFAVTQSIKNIKSYYGFIDEILK